jgi:hypothetical protein
MTHSLSAFFTAYSARRGGAPVEAIAVIVSDGPDSEPALRFVVVDEAGLATIAAADEVDLYGVFEDAREVEEGEARDAGLPTVEREA